MKKLTFLFVFMLLATAGFSQTMSTIGKGAPLNDNTGAITGYLPLATPTITLTDAAKLITVSSPLPRGTIAVNLIASGAFNYGASTVLTSTSGAFMTVADKGVVRIPIYPGLTLPSIYVVNNATGSTTNTVRIIAEVQR